MKENEYVVINDIYITKVDEDKYIITDEELSKLIIKYRTLEFLRRDIDNRYDKYRKQAEKRIKHYYTLAHTYKVELGRCRRKLTRIYKALDDVEINMVKEFLLRYDTAIVLRLMELIKSIKKLLKSI